MKTDLFQSCGHCCIFQICWHIECSTFTASSFRIWNSSTGIPSPPLALFVVMLSKAHLTSHSRISNKAFHYPLVSAQNHQSWHPNPFRSRRVPSCVFRMVTTETGDLHRRTKQRDKSKMLHCWLWRWRKTWRTKGWRNAGLEAGKSKASDSRVWRSATQSATSFKPSEFDFRHLTSQTARESMCIVLNHQSHSNFLQQS